MSEDLFCARSFAVAIFWPFNGQGKISNKIKALSADKKRTRVGSENPTDDSFEGPPGLRAGPSPIIKRLFLNTDIGQPTTRLLAAILWTSNGQR
jgi:hypothetical protein